MSLHDRLMSTNGELIQSRLQRGQWEWSPTASLIQTLDKPIPEPELKSSRCCKKDVNPPLSTGRKLHVWRHAGHLLIFVGPFGFLCFRLKL